MKLNSSVLGIALMCVSLLLSLSPACSKKEKGPTQTPPTASSTATPSTATPTASSTATPTATATPTPTATATPTPTPSPAPSPKPSPASSPEPLTPEGTFKLNDSAAATKTINDAIEAAVKDTVFFLRDTARDELRKKNLPPPPQINIAYAPAGVTIKTFLGAIQTPVNGTSVDRVVAGDKVKVSTTRTDQKLVRIYKTGVGQRVNTYSLSPDGNTLTLQVTGTSSVTKPCVYELKYRRVD